MEAEELKRQMMDLWKETFHDTDEYVTMVFDRYFSLSRVAWREREGRVVSALLGVEYPFVCSGRRLRGLYLCGLSTREDLRGLGLMSELIEEINLCAQRKGFDFTFLLPANDGLRKYYSDRGYHDGIFVNQRLYMSNHDFRKELSAVDENLLGEYDDYVCSSLHQLSDDEKMRCYKFVAEREQNSGCFGMVHSLQDLILVTRDNEMSGGEIFVCKDENEDYKGVVWCVPETDNKVVVKMVCCSDAAAYYKLLDSVNTNFSGRTLSVIISAETEHRHDNVVLGKAYIREGGVDNIEGREGEYNIVTSDLAAAYPFGMVRLLNIDNICLQICAAECSCEKATKFVISDEREFVISTEKEGSAKNYKTDLENENVSTQIICDKCDTNSFAGFTKDEIAKLLMRHPSQHNELQNLLKMPRLELASALLLE